jgi:hypothetical protein
VFFFAKYDMNYAQDYTKSNTDNIHHAPESLRGVWSSVFILGAIST